ncbi:MAG: TetR/AcrR family transcriptional regulator [Chitinophagales bacterium]|nr:TetR/AcrR family transcriptional regulator [Chitinophagales bacterium]
MVKEQNIEQQDELLAFKIHEKATELFRTIGVRNTTMDDLAKELGISKKTLYKVIGNKADLVLFCISKDINQRELELKAIEQQATNAIEEMILVGKVIYNSLQIFHPSTIHDLMKFYPRGWEKIEEHKVSFSNNLIKKNIREGIAQKLYREDIDIELVSDFYVSLSTLSLHNYSNHSKYTVSTVFKEILAYHINAIALPKGKELFNQLFNQFEI